MRINPPIRFGLIHVTQRGGGLAEDVVNAKQVLTKMGDSSRDFVITPLDKNHIAVMTGVDRLQFLAEMNKLDAFGQSQRN